MTWRPAMTISTPDARPQIGDVVALAHRAWEVMHLREATPTEDEQQWLDTYPATRRAERAPYRVTLRRLHGAPHQHENDRGEVGYRIRAGAYRPFRVYLDGRVPLCSCHGHPWPCLESEQQAYAERELRAAERELNRIPGCCPACDEPITSRQRSITFGGPNVRNPLAEGPTYHLRRRCRSAAAQYEDLWAADEPGRPRSLLTLRCEGILIVHGDGTGECFGANGSECPSIYAQHRHMTACYWQSHGCPRECPRQGHPGIRLAGRPDDPRAVTLIEGGR